MDLDATTRIPPGRQRRRPALRRILLWLAGPLLPALLTPPLSGQGQYTMRIWQSEDGLPVDLVRSIVQGTDGHMWLATAEGITRFDGLEFEAIPMPAGFTFPHSGPHRLFATADGAIWFSSFRGGLVRIDDGKARVIWPDSDVPDDDPVSQLFDTADGEVLARSGPRCWRITGGQAAEIDPGQATITTLLDDDIARRSRGGRIGPTGQPGILVDRNGSTWSPVADGGLTTTSPEGIQRPVAMPRVGADFEVTEMLEDQEGNIWVATSLHGLALIREDRVELLTAAAELGRDAVLAVIQDSRGSTWIANRNGGIDLLHDKGVDHHDLLVGDQGAVISALYEDRNGRLWAATRDGPVFRWLGWRFVEQFLGDEDPRQVNAVYQDSNGTMWFGGGRGLVRSTGQGISRVGPEAGFPGGEVTVMAGGAGGELWLGTDQGFVLRDSDGRLRTVGSPGDLSYRRVSGILVEAADRVWVTTLGSGLFLFNGRSWQHFGTDQGLPDARLTHLIDDRLGHLWFGSTGGILRAARDDLLARAGDPEAPIHWLRMDRSDGLPARECVGGHNPAGWRFNDGTICFPTTLGVVRLDPSRTKVNRTPPPVFIRRVAVDGITTELPQGTLQVGPGATRLEFRYQGLNFSAPEKVTYRTRLIGFEDSWREVGTQRAIIYDAVPPGDYQFQVFAMNGDGVLSTSPANIQVEVRPHFWQTGWFIVQLWLLLSVVAGGVGWIIARSRMKRRITLLKIRSARETERARIARDLHDDLGASLTEISLLAGLSAEQAEGSEFHPHLDELSDRSREVARALDEIVWAVNPREDTLDSLIDYLGGFATEFLDRAGIALRLGIPTGLPDSPMDATLRHSIFLSVREAFNNIAKHSGAETAWLRVALENGMLEISIEDDGRGIDEEQIGHGHGLENFRARMAACNGECDLKPRPDGGTIVRFRVPLLAAGAGSS